MLRARGVERIVIVGLATDYCVVETVEDARRLGFEVEVPTGAIRAVNLEPGDGDAALDRMRIAGATLT
jgi:nicotinamidase/pyrazinamidase